MFNLFPYKRIREKQSYLLIKISNPKHQITNKSQIQISNDQNVFD